MAATNHQIERDRYNTLKGRLASMEAIREQLRERKIADDADVEIKSSFFKHRTRRFQAVNVWPSEASAGEEDVIVLTPDVGELIVQLAERRGAPTGSVPTPRVFVMPQRARWFKVRQFNRELAKAGEQASESELVELAGLDVSGSQGQILAVVMGLRAVEDQLRRTPFKEVVALSALSLHERGEIRLSDAQRERAVLNEIGKTPMLMLYGADVRRIARTTQRDSDRYGGGLDKKSLDALFKGTPVVRELGAFLAVCKAVGFAAYEKDPTRGVTVVDPLDGESFTWNPAQRRKKPISSGAFKLYVHAPIVTGDGGHKVDKRKLARRIAPGMIHMADALFAGVVIGLLSQLGVSDVVAIHDAFLVPGEASAELKAALEVAGRFWLPKLGPFYDVFERYLPATSPEGKIARQWRIQWEQRVAECEAGRDTWPTFLTKHEGADFR